MRINKKQASQAGSRDGAKTHQRFMRTVFY